MTVYIIMAFLILLIGRINISFRFGDRPIGNRLRSASGENYEHRLKYWLWFIILTLVSGLRGENVGTDTRGYLMNFKAYNGFGSGNTNQELLFSMLNRAIGYFTTNPQWLLIICSAIFNACVLYFIRNNSERTSLSVFYFVALYYYFLAMNGMRQFLAIGFVLIATEFAKKRRVKPFLLFIAIAFGFHKSSIVGIVMWFIYKPKATVKRMVAIAIAMIGMILTFASVQGFVAKYFESYSALISGRIEYSPGKMMPIIYSFIFLASAFVAFLDKEWREKNENMSLLCISEIAMLWGISPLILTSISTNIAQRIGWPFQIYSMVLIPNLLSSGVFKKHRTLYVLLFIVIGFMHLVYFLLKGWHRVVPYYFCFS